MNEATIENWFLTKENREIASNKMRLALTRLYEVHIGCTALPTGRTACRRKKRQAHRLYFIFSKRAVMGEAKIIVNSDFDIIT